MDAWSCELLASRLRHAKPGPLGAGNAARRRVRRIVMVGIGLLRHDGDVAGVVMRFQNDEATIVFHECFRAGCRYMRNLSASLALP